MEISSALANSTMTGGGMVTYGPNSSEIVELAKGRTILRLSQSSIRLADDPTSLFHLVSEDCRGTLILAVDGSREIARGYCDKVDADGDVWWRSWREIQMQTLANPRRHGKNRRHGGRRYNYISSGTT